MCSFVIKSSPDAKEEKPYNSLSPITFIQQTSVPAFGKNLSATRLHILIILRLARLLVRQPASYFQIVSTLSHVQSETVVFKLF